jgi:para-nitrobenzyl esterase
MVSYWSNFAKTGNPNGGSLPEWPAYTRERRESLTIGNKNTYSDPMIDNPVVKVLLKHEV